jgi:hypothetical protein
MNAQALSRSARLAGLAGLLAVAPALAGRMDHVESRTETKRFTLAAVSGQRELVIDNVIGSVAVRAGTGDAIEVTVKESYEAESAADLARALAEVELEVHEAAGRLELLQGGSWRCRGERDRSARDEDRRGGDRDGDCCCERDHDRDYMVRYDWTVVVPRELDLTVKTVNEGAIRVEGVSGRLKIRNVNDDVTLADVGGRVDAKTVNGEVKVDFRSLPSGDSKFATVNGDIDLGFPKGLGAELTFATMNGEVFTDFAYTLGKNPPPPPTSERGSGKHGKRHHSLGKRTAARLGGGGHALDCDTINGDITIRERG